MKVSVVVPAWSTELYDDFAECVEAVLAQTHDDVEAVIVVDGKEEIEERARADWGDRDDVIIYRTHEDAGPISRANMGAVQATGDVVAITDADAVPETDWVAELVDAYERHDAVAVGGRIEPKWVAGEAEYVPEEFYFLIGATQKGFADGETEVRNTFGGNISFKRDVYLRLGGIKLGGIDPNQVQGRETELCTRMQREYGQGVIYNPDAVVSHKIYDYRTEKRWLVERAFWQGYSKRAMAVLVPDSTGDESEFLGRLLTEFVPNRVRELVARPTKPKAAQLVTLFVLLAATGFGFLWGLVKWR
jgi:glycosyltransferase involved in cell wall biosynthesis